MTFASEIAVLEGLGEDGRIGTRRAQWDQYGRGVGLNTLSRKNVIDPSEGGNYSGGSSWTGGVPLTPSNQGLAAELADLEAMFSAYEGDGRIGQTRAQPNQYAKEVGLNVLYRGRVIDASEGANYSGGGSYASGLPLLPSSQGLADDDPYPDLTAFFNSDGSGVLPTRRNIVDPGGGALYTGGSSYEPGIPMLPSSQGLSRYPDDYLAGYPDDYIAGLAAVADNQAGKAGKLDNQDRNFAVRLGQRLGCMRRPVSKDRAMHFMGKLRERLAKVTDEGMRQRLTRRMAMLTQVVAKLDNPNIKQVSIARGRPLAKMRTGETKPLEGCIRPFDRAGAAATTGAAPACIGPSCSLEGLATHFEFEHGPLDTTLTGLDDAPNDIEAAVRAAGSPSLAKGTAAKIENRADALDKLAAERASVVTQSRREYDALLREVEALDKRVLNLASRILASDGTPLPSTPPGQVRELERMIVQRKVATDRALDFARINLLATALARNASTQAAIGRTIAESVRIGSPLAVATLAPTFAHLARVSGDIRQLREQQRDKQAAASDEDAYKALLRKKSELLEQLAQVTRDAAASVPLTESQKGYLHTLQSTLASVNEALQRYHADNGLEGRFGRWLKKKVKKAAKTVKKGVKSAAKGVGKGIKTAAKKTYSKAIKPVGKGLKAATKGIAKGLGKVVDFSCRLANSTVMRVAKQVVGQAVGTVVGTVYGGQPEMGRRAGALVADRANSIDKSACGSFKKVGIYEGKFDRKQARRELKSSAKAIVKHHLDWKGAIDDVGGVVGGDYYKSAKHGIQLVTKNPKALFTKKGLKEFLIDSHKQAVTESVKQYAKEYAGEGASKVLDNAAINVPAVAQGVKFAKKAKETADQVRAVKKQVDDVRKQVDDVRSKVDDARAKVRQAQGVIRDVKGVVRDVRRTTSGGGGGSPFSFKVPKVPQLPSATKVAQAITNAKKQAAKIEAAGESAATRLLKGRVPTAKLKLKAKASRALTPAELLIQAAGA